MNHVMTPMHDDASLQKWRTEALAIERHIGDVFIGQAAVIRLVTIAVYARGHVLLQGDVGVGKTTLLRAFSRAVGGAFARIEGSVDLLPNDLLYYAHLGRDGRPVIEPGPLLVHGENLAILFFNEINRARPQVHAMLLRAMAERSITAFNTEHRFPHLVVFADRNRVEREETFDVAAAALDRFMLEIAVDMPQDDALLLRLLAEPRFHDTDALLHAIPEGLIAHQELNAAAAQIQLHTQTSAALLDYALKLWKATRAPADFGVALSGVSMEHLMLAGASPRGMSMLLRAARVAAWLDGRDFVTPDDIRCVFEPVVAHRLSFQPMYDLRRTELAAEFTRAILAQIAAP